MVIRLLFLSANPYDTQRLQVTEEYNDIDDKLRAATYRDQFDLIQRHAISLDKLASTLLRYEPQIIHFSGHGSNEGALIFQNSDLTTQEVPPPALTELFRIINRDKDVHCVFLNACYSEPQAKAISKYIDCVIGMSNSITDMAARAFAGYFYEFLGYGKSIKDAFDLGIVQLRFLGTPEEHIPKLICEPGVDPYNVFVLGKKNVNEIKDDTKVTNTINTIKESVSPSSTTSSLPSYDWRIWLPSFLRE